MLSSQVNVIAIDGPSGSGKSSVAIALAKKLNGLYVDTGAMFRALSAFFIDQKMDIAQISDNMFMKYKDQLKMQYDYSDSTGVSIKVSGKDYTQSLRLHEISRAASDLSKIASVREYLLEFQRSLVKSHLVIMEGRDIGTVVFPNAICKIFLTASLKTRTKRRHLDLKNQGKEISLEQLSNDLKARDEQDSNRAHAPLKPASDAVFLDSDPLNQAAVVERISEIYSEKLKSKG